MDSEADAQTPQSDPNTLYVEPRGAETQAAAMARCSLTPAVQGAITVKHFGSNPLTGASLNTLVTELSEHCNRSNSGDLAQSEAMLTAQSHSLDAIFNKLARMASTHLVNGGNVEIADTLLRLGMRAQSQCRATIEALAEIKNPSHVAFVKQANISSGPQQVNNGATARTENNRIPQNKLLEQVNGERLDFGTQGQTVGDYTRLEAVGAVHRASNDRRQSRSSQKRL